MSWKRSGRLGICEADGEVLSSGGAGGALGGGDGEAFARINLLAMFGGGLLALGLQFLRSAEAAVGLALGEQAFGVRAIDV